MSLIDRIAEAKITEAIGRGEFDNLAGAGEPLVLDDDSMVPEELRAAYRVLKNAGYVPPEVRLLREIHDVEALLPFVHDVGERANALKRLNLLIARLDTNRGARANLLTEQGYYQRLLTKLDRQVQRDDSVASGGAL